MNKRIKKALEDKNGGNQSEMARFIDVSPQAIQKWIAGISEPRGKNLTKAAEFLGISELELRYGDENKFRADSSKSPAWPFSISYDLFVALPTSERDRVDKQVKYMITDWHAQHRIKSKKAG